MLRLQADSFIPGIYVAPEEEEPGLHNWRQVPGAFSDRDIDPLDQLDPLSGFRRTGGMPESGVPAPSNDNRFYVCTEAAHGCLQNTPSGADRMRDGCLTAENLCNNLLGLTRNTPFPKDVAINFPDGGRVEVPAGRVWSGRYIPAIRFPR